MLTQARDSAAMRRAFWVVVVATLVAGAWLVATEHLLPAAAVLLPGAVLAAVLGLLGHRQGVSVIDLSADGLRRRGGVMVTSGVVVLVVGAVVWVLGQETPGRVLVLAGVSLTLAAVGVLRAAHLGRD